MKFWRPLEAGDTIDLVAPGFACKPEELEGALAYVRGWGFRPRIPKGLFAKDVLCSSPDASRLDSLKKALLAEDSKAVWCLRGGYGSIRLVPSLSKMRAPRAPKLFVGLSDITTLHLFLNQNWKWPTIHGPMMDRLGKGETPARFERELRDLISGEKDEVVFKGLRPMNAPARKTARVRAPVSGGNLITLQSSLGTAIEYNPKGTIVFLEDIGERGYRVDRVLEHFAQAGLWKGVRAVVFGDFTGGREPDGTERVPKVLQRFADAMPFPVLKGIQSGHGPVQRPVPFGTRAELILGSSASLVVGTGARA